MPSSFRALCAKAPVAVVAAGIALTGASAVQANGINVPQPQAPVFVEPAPSRAFPSVFGINSAIAPVGGTGFVALTYVDPREGRAGSDSDGELSFGYTFGNPLENLSVSVSANITGLDPFGDSGNFDISIARSIFANSQWLTFIGASAGGIGAYGSATADEEAYSVYISHLSDIGSGASAMPYQVTLGYGNAIERATDGTGTVGEGFFFGVGLGVTPNMSLSASGTETQLNLGGMLTFDALPGFSLSGGVYDVTDATNRQQVSVTAAFSF